MRIASPASPPPRLSADPARILNHVGHEGNPLCFGACPLVASITDGLKREAEMYLHHKDDHRVPVFVRVSTLRNSTGEVIGGIGVFTDIGIMLICDARVQEPEKSPYSTTSPSWPKEII